MTTSSPPSLFDLCWQTLLTLLPEDIQSRIQEAEDPGNLPYELQLIDFLGSAIDTHLDEDDDEHILWLTTMNPQYLTTEPVAVGCVFDRDVTACHVLYHVIYEDLKACLEQRFDEYIREVRAQQ